MTHLVDDGNTEKGLRKGNIATRLLSFIEILPGDRYAPGVCLLQQRTALYSERVFISIAEAFNCSQFAWPME